MTSFIQQNADKLGVNGIAINYTFMIMMYYLFILPSRGGNLKRIWRAYMLSQIKHVVTAFIGGTL